MGEKVGNGFTTQEPEAANTEVRFEKGNPVEGWWYVDDRGFTKVRTTKVFNQAGGFVAERHFDKDLMEDI